MTTVNEDNNYKVTVPDEFSFRILFFMSTSENETETIIRLRLSEHW